MIKEQEWCRDGDWIKKFYMLLILIDLFFGKKCNSRKRPGVFSRYFGGVTIFQEIQGVSHWRGENNHYGAFNFYPIFIPCFESKVSGVSVQDMLLRQSFLTPET